MTKSAPNRVAPPAPEAGSIGEKKRTRNANGAWAEWLKTPRGWQLQSYGNKTSITHLL